MKVIGIGQMLKLPSAAFDSISPEACAGELPLHVAADPAHQTIVANSTAALVAKKGKPHPNGYGSMSV